MNQPKPYAAARAAIPADAVCSSSFGYAGQGGYREYWRDASGQRWVIGNGEYDAGRPFHWSAMRVED